VVAALGPSLNANPTYAGTFDHAYLASVDGTGKLYAIGKSAQNNNRATLYRVSITAGTMSSAPDASSDPSGGFLLTTAGGGGSPVTGFYNSTTAKEYLFMSVGRRGVSPCSNANIGCVISLDITAPFTWPPAAPTATYTVPDNSNYPGVSGIVVDNNAAVGTYPQAASLYFTFGQSSTAGALCNGGTGVGCAVKLTQAGLQ
jgi:hypothetical protein